MTQRKMYKCIPTTGKKNNSFVGIRANNSLIEVCYPESLRLSSVENQQRQEILALIKSISLAKTKYAEASEIFVAKNTGENFVVDAYIWILDDYVQHRRYTNVEKEYRENVRGRINWKKTMRQTPIVSDSNIVFKNFVVEIKHQQDNLLTEIYKYCVRVASNAIGWLIGIITDETESISFNKIAYLQAIQKELESTFDDEKRKRLNIMKSIVSEISSEDDLSSSFSYGVNDYSFVYERMVDSLYGNVKKIQDYYPNGEWSLRCFDKAFSSSNLRPDTVIDLVKGTYILDAKFYRFGTTKSKADLPNTTSIQKQITYGEFINNIYHPKKVVNAFVMPYNKKNNPFGLKGNLECIGFSTAKWKEQNNSFEYVFALLLDMQFLLSNWFKDNTEEYRKELISILDSSLNDIICK